MVPTYHRLELNCVMRRKQNEIWADIKMKFSQDIVSKLKGWELGVGVGIKGFDVDRSVFLPSYY